MPGRRTGKATFINTVAFIILEATAFYILLSFPNPQQNRISTIGIGFCSSVWGFFDGIGNYLHLRSRCDSLANENYMLRQELLNNACENNDVRIWKKPLGDYSYLDSRVVTSSKGSQHNYLILDRGAFDGVTKDDGVITPHGAVGIVQNVTDYHCLVASYLNGEISVSAKLGRNGIVGSLSWSGKSEKQSVLTGIPVHIQASVGDTVFTSGFSTIFPPDIPLGRVVSKKSVSGSSSNILVEMFENFSSLHYVMIVHNNDRAEIEALIDE